MNLVLNSSFSEGNFQQIQKQRDSFTESPSTHYLPNVSSYQASQVAQSVKNLPTNAGDTGLIPWWGKSPGEGNGNHSSILAWRIPWTEEPGGLYSS